MRSRKKGSGSESVFRCGWRPVPGPGILLWVSLIILACGFPLLAQSQPSQSVPGAQGAPSVAPEAKASTAGQSPDQQLTGSISGIVTDMNGGIIAGAGVTLTRDDQSPVQEEISGDDGKFSFANIAPGPFHLTIVAADFNTQTVSGTLNSGEAYAVPRIVLGVSRVATQVSVGISHAERAEYQFQDEEKQRVLGVIPNFYVTYTHDAAPLTVKRKFILAWKVALDPFTFGFTGAIAGVEQSQNDYSGYGRGAQGFAKRFGAKYADFVSGTFIGGAVLPSLLRQDPRYFYKGTGSTRSRFLHAIASSIICKGDNGHWEPNYSNVLGNLAAGGLSNLYYPAQNRTGLGLAVENGMIGIGATAVVNIIEEFVIPRWMPNHPERSSAKP